MYDYVVPILTYTNVQWEEEGGLCFSCAADNSTKLTFPCYFITSILNIYIGQFLGQGYQKIEYIFFRLVFTVKYIGIGMYVRRIF